MGLVVDTAQALAADVGVDLRGSQVGVAEQLLHGPEVGAPVEQMGGEGVAQGVRMRRRRRAPVEDAANVPRRETTAALVQEQRVPRLGPNAGRHHWWSPVPEPGV